MHSSFSTDAKDALARETPSQDHCRRALRQALLLYKGSQRHFVTRRSSIARLYRTLDERAELQRRANGYRLSIGEQLREMPAKPARRCDRVMEARGAFLACGSVSAGARGYHLEFAVPTRALTERLGWLLRSLGARSKRMQRRAHDVLYLKDFEAIVDFLTIIGAHGAVLRLSNVRAIKDTKNRIRRLVNTEAANVERAVNAAAAQSETIALLRDTYGLSHLTAPLREIASLRLNHPDETLTELGKRCRPPVSKPTVSSRLRVLMRLARGETSAAARKT